MLEKLDPRSPTPLYAQIAQRIRAAIAAGELEAGQALPSVRSLAADVRVNPATVVQAYRDLEADGFVITRRGSGSFVRAMTGSRKSEERAQQARTLVRELITEAARRGVSPEELKEALDEQMNGAGGNEVQYPRTGS